MTERHLMIQMRCVGWIAATCLLAGCAASTASYPIRQRARGYDTTKLDEDYREEHEYIQRRREAAGTPDVFLKEFWPECYDPSLGSYMAERCAAQWRVLRERAEAGVQPSNLVGLAFSGGGIRSANFSLGVLQGLDVQRVLPQLDYLSAVSGGAYMAGWVQAHLGGDQHGSCSGNPQDGPAGFCYDDLNYKVAAKDFHDLLDGSGDNVEHLRTHAGFLNQGGWFEATKAVWSYAWRWPFNFVVDVVVHVKGRINLFHPIAIYYDRLEETYFRGDPPKGPNSPPAKRALALREVNFNTTTPYTIINGNLVNQGCSRQAAEDSGVRGSGPVEPGPGAENPRRPVPPRQA